MGRSSSSHRNESKKSSKKSSRDEKHKRGKTAHKRHRDSEGGRRSSDHSSRRRSEMASDHLTPLGDAFGRAPDKLLNIEEDYFAYHEHLWVYLYRIKGRAFNDLTSDQTHRAFAKFVKEYNAGSLTIFYHDSLPAYIVEECKTTRHKWSFQISDAEDKSLRSLTLGVKSQTDYRGHGTDNQASSERPTPSMKASKSLERNDDDDGAGRKSAEDRYQERVANKRLKQHVETVHEELTFGRPDYGRERQLEKRRQVGERTHGAARDREEATELTDDVIYGNDSHGFQSALQREKLQALKREEQQQRRQTELKQKEEERKQEMMRKLGIQPGQKFSIQPRNDS